MDQAKKILLSILKIIDYRKDKNKFANEFIDLCCRKTFVECVSALNPQTKETVDQELKGEKQLDRCLLVLERYISKETFEEKLSEVSNRLFVEYIKAVMVPLDQKKKAVLKTYLSQVKTLSPI